MLPSLLPPVQAQVAKPKTTTTDPSAARRAPHLGEIKRDGAACSTAKIQVACPTAPLPSDLEDAAADEAAQRRLFWPTTTKTLRFRTWRTLWGTRCSWRRRRSGPQAERDLFAGVHFMAETAKILKSDAHGAGARPKRELLAGRRLPGREAACLAAEGFSQPRHGQLHQLLCGGKSDLGLHRSSSNAEKIIRSYPEDQPILFAPDQHLGRWLQKKTGRQKHRLLYPARAWSTG